MIAGVLLLYAVGVYCSDRSSALTQTCVPSHKVDCFTPADYKNVTGPVNIEVYAGKKLNISLEDEYTACHWSRGEIPVLNGSHILSLPTLSKTDSGEYTLQCETQNGNISSMNVSLHVVMKRPTKPQLIPDRFEPKQSLSFKCITDGFPDPLIEWSNKRNGDNGRTDDGNVTNVISSIEFYKKTVVCCAYNDAGRDCSQLYNDALTTVNSVSNITLSPGQSLLLRCTGKETDSLEWQKDLIKMNTECPSRDKKGICIKYDEHYELEMMYLSIESLDAGHSGTYTCRSGNKTKSFHVSVQAEGFLSVQLEESIIIPVENISTSCLQANVSYHPFLQTCTWETPDKMTTECKTDPWETEHRTVKLCDQLKTGVFKLHIEAGGKTQTKAISLCVAEPPQIKIHINKANNAFTAETESLVPANYTWMSCSNDSCETDSSWEVIAQTSKTDSDVSCKKMIRSSLNSEIVSGNYVKFCLTNFGGHRCQKRLYHPSEVAKTYGLPDEDKSTTFLKIGSILLLLALTVVTIVLFYFIKKRKPKYEPQLQMIQMVGPNDNDYIYINFKDFEYDSKWEFPKENLELGKELGSGAFGMVVQATAYGINKPGVSQQVAVKMLKEKHQAVEKEALMSELKMLTHIGHHANIVNLLGACTETGPIYLIFQYCCYGDLLNYLKNNSQRYHKSVTDAFNKDRFSSLYHNMKPGKERELQTTVDNYVPMYSSTTRGQEAIALLTLNSDDMDSFEDIFDNLNEQTKDLQAVTFDDLLSFAYQVAKGMEFLSSKNCIHRDLAARNVLVTKGRLVKIGDFGLARDIDNDSNYVVRGNVRLPVKWMAPESIFQGMYTMKSDVWAYGILLWEIFSLGVTPYPGIKVDHTFYSMIERGFKMECPYYANESVYDIMCKCWELDSGNRPSFSKLVSFMAAQLTEREEKLYHNMLDSNSGNYQNASSFVLEISALKEENENKTEAGNNYCLSYGTEESKAKLCNSDSVADDLLKTNGKE